MKTACLFRWSNVVLIMVSCAGVAIAASRADARTAQSARDDPGGLSAPDAARPDATTTACAPRSAGSGAVGAPDTGPPEVPRVGPLASDRPGGMGCFGSHGGAGPTGEGPVPPQQYSGTAPPTDPARGGERPVTG